MGLGSDRLVEESDEATPHSGDQGVTPLLDTNAPTPENRLDDLRHHPEWDEATREACFSDLVAGFDPETLRLAALQRVKDLSGADAEAVLRLLEMHGDDSAFDALASALLDQPDLPAERAWEALSVLVGTGLLDRHPALAERWEELEELLAEPIAPDELAQQLNADPESVWVALEALNGIEPNLRASIVDDLKGQPANPGLLAFLNALALSEDTALRDSARGVLDELEGDEKPLSTSTALTGRPVPEIVRTLVTAVDPDGRGEVVVVSRLGGSWVAAAYSIDVQTGLLEVFGHQAESAGEVDLFVTDVLERLDRDAEACSTDLALGLLAGSLKVSEDRPEAPLTLPYWLDRTVGPGLHQRLFAIPALETDPAATAPQLIREAADAVLNACPGWLDQSHLTEELARDLAERPGPPREVDPSATRFLVERAFLDRIETLRRMLLWMAAFWTARDDQPLTRACLLLAGHLADNQHVVPGHPFLSGLARRSLLAAAQKLQLGAQARPSARALETKLDEQS
jgi:hypothetical protein